MNDGINIEQLVIMIDSNIPNIEPFEFKRSMLYHPNLKFAKKYKFSDLPYITKSMKYPAKKLFALVKNNYIKMLRFFFDKKYFETKLSGFMRSEKIQKNDDEDEILKFNINIMIELLFPTTFPALRNFSSSFDEYIKGKNIGNYSFKESVYSTNFSYLKHSGKTYTITKVTWLNDLFNHPIYRSFIEEFNNYSIWAKNEEKNIKGRIGLLKEKIIGRIINENVHDSLYIKNYLEVFDSNKGPNAISQDVKDEMKSKDFRDYEKKKFYDTLDDFHKLFNEFLENINKDVDFDKIYSNIEDMNEMFKRLNENKSVTLKGVKKEFTNNLSVIFKELKKINILSKVSKKYITEGEVNIKLEGEDEDVVKELNTNYKRFIDFIDKIKVLLTPIRESSNTELQNIIIEYSENKSNKFGEILRKIKEEFILLKPISYFSSDINKSNLYTGINFINKTDYKAPHYEVYLGIDVMEGEINNSNLKQIKCKYRGLYLGQETELYFSKYNKYDFSTHRVYVPIKEDFTDEDAELKASEETEAKSEKIEKKEENKEKEEKEGKNTTKGGRKKNKYRKTIKRRK